MRQQETKAERKIERYRREGVEQKSRDGNAAGRKGYAQCDAKPQLQGRRHWGEKGMASIGSMRKPTLQGRDRKEKACLREGKSKTEKKETGKSGIMNIATVEHGRNWLPGSQAQWAPYKCLHTCRNVSFINLEQSAKNKFVISY